MGAMHSPLGGRLPLSAATAAVVTAVAGEDTAHVHLYAPDSASKGFDLVAIAKRTWQTRADSGVSDEAVSVTSMFRQAYNRAWLHHLKMAQLMQSKAFRLLFDL